AGWFAAGAHARRLRRLEVAAGKVAEGDFRTPIPNEGADEVGQLAAALDEMQRRLARLDSARKAFIANASHELRTPIFSLAGFAELLEDEDPDPAARAEFVRNMREQIARLTKLTADLLDLSKLDSDAIEIRAEPVELGEVADRVAAEFGPAAERHASPIEVRFQGPALARADPDRVAQIMRILIDNALTHTPAGTSSAVSAYATNGSAALVVADDGRGGDGYRRVRRGGGADGDPAEGGDRVRRPRIQPAEDLCEGLAGRRHDQLLLLRLELDEPVRWRRLGGAGIRFRDRLERRDRDQ